MTGRLNQVLAFAAAALLAAPFFASSSYLAAQQQAQGRFRVLIPDFFPAEGTDDDFGKDTAEDLRDMMDELATHEAIDKDEIEDNLDRFDLDMDDLSCIETRQLGSQINAQVSMCASYEEIGDDMVRVSEIQFWDQTGTAFEVEPFEIDEGEREEAATRILERFDGYVQQLRFRQYCADYASSQDWENALRNCNQALDLNSDDNTVRMVRARVFFNTDRLEESLEELQVILEADPFNEEALQLAGYVATQLGQNEVGRDYYAQYLEINPNADRVRRRIAYDMYEAGDPEGAMLLIEEGLELEGNPDLMVDFGNYAFAAAAERMQDTATAGGDAESGSLPPEVQEYYREAIDAYTGAFDALGDSMSVGALRNVVNAHVQLGEVEQAIDFGARVTEVHPEDAGAWSVLANAHQRAGNLDDAVAALDQVVEIDPDYPNLYARQGKWMLDAGRVEDAIPFLERAVERGQDPNTMARLLLAEAHGNGVTQERWNYAIDVLTQAKEAFDLSQQAREELDFWHGWSVYQRAVGNQEPGTVETARATLPQFQRARELFSAAEGYGSRQASINIGELLNAADTYIEIQEAIIKRAGG
jgi:tetratricopeptide (TPR) repeat protein